MPFIELMRTSLLVRIRDKTHKLGLRESILFGRLLSRRGTFLEEEAYELFAIF